MSSVGKWETPWRETAGTFLIHAVQMNVNAKWLLYISSYLFAGHITCPMSVSHCSCMIREGTMFLNLKYIFYFVCVTFHIICTWVVSECYYKRISLSANHSLLYYKCISLSANNSSLYYKCISLSAINSSLRFYYSRQIHTIPSYEKWLFKGCVGHWTGTEAWEYYVIWRTCFYSRGRQKCSHQRFVGGTMIIDRIHFIL